MVPVQTGPETGCPSGTSTAVFSANTTVGNSIVVVVWQNFDTTAISSAMGTFTRVASLHFATTAYLDIFVCENVTSAGENITVTSGGTSYLVAFEWPGEMTATSTLTGSTTGNSTSPSNTVTPSAASQLVYAIAGNNGGSTFTSGPGSPWTSAGAAAIFWGNSGVASWAWQVVPSTSNVTATWVLGSNPWGTLVAGFTMAPPSALNAAGSPVHPQSQAVNRSANY